MSVFSSFLKYNFTSYKILDWHSYHWKVSCDTCSWRNMHKCLLTAEREPMASQSQLDKLMNCVRVTHRNIDERSFAGAEMMQRQLITKSPDKHGWQVTKAGILELTVQLVGNSTGERIVFQATLLISISFRKIVWPLSLPDVCFVSTSCRQLSWFESFPESSTGLFLSQVIWLVSDSSRQLSWSGSVSPQSCCI